MSGNLFDVFVVGSTDPSAAGETRLAAALSAKHGLPLATVAKAIAAKNLRAGQGLDQAQAQALVRHLQSIGAVTVIRAALRPQGHPGSPSQVASAPAVPPGSTPTMSPGGARSPAPSPASGRPGAGSSPGAAHGSAPAPVATAFGMPPLTPAAPADPFAPMMPSSPRGPAVGADPFQPKHVPTPAIVPKSSGTPTPSPMHLAQPPASGLALDRGAGSSLQLDRPEPVSGEHPVLGSARASTSEVSLREIGMKASSGVAVDADPKNLNLVRCVQHGLYYDRTKASGCRKCLSSARDMVNKMEAAKVTGFHIADLRRKPARRAFLGLGLALLLGFLPAIYYCFGPGTMGVRKLRVEQELLSRQPGTDEIMQRFDELETNVNEAHRRSSRNTAIVWVSVSSLALLGWYRIT